MVKFANFDGSSGTVVVSGYLGVPDDDNRSISFWIRTTQDTGTICWWGNDLTSTVGDGEQCRVRLLDRGHVEIFGKGSFCRSASQVNDGNFHHVAFTWTNTGAPQGHDDFARANVYIDGVLDNGKVRGGSKLEIQPDGSQRTQLGIRTVEEEELVIGARPELFGDFTEFYQGDLDEFAVYRDVLDVTTVTGIYNDGVQGADLLALGHAAALQFWYRMGDDAGDVAPTLSAPSGALVDQNPFTSRNAVISSGVVLSGQPVVVGATKATTPPTGSTSASGFTVVIPVPAGTRSGDLLLAAASFDGIGGTITPPVGWSTVLSRDYVHPSFDEIHWVISSGIATDNEPVDYTWTFDIAAAPRSGCMIALRAPSPPTVGDSAFADVTGTVPDVTNSGIGSMLVAFALGRVSNPPTELAAANLPLLLQVQHVAKGTVPALSESVVIAVEEIPASGVISGRTFTHPSPLIPFTAGIIVEDNS
jgi:hypothetical protein